MAALSRYLSLSKLSAMSEHEAFYKAIHGEYKALNEAMKQMNDQQIEISGSIKGIGGHLSRLNGHIGEHKAEIEMLKEYRIRHESECEAEKKRSELLAHDKKKMIQIIIMLVGSLIISIIVGHFT